MSDRRSLWLIGLLLAALAVGVYARNIDDYFVADDFDLIVSFYNEPPSYFLKLLVWNESNRIWKTLGNDPELGHGYIRPFKIWLLKLDTMLWGANPVGYHLVSTAFFVLNVVGVFWLLIRFLIPGRPALAFLGGLITAVHPVFAETVPFITAREEIIASGFALLSVIWFFKHRLEGASSFGFLLCYVIGLLTKESAITAVGIVAGWDVAAWAIGREGWRAGLERARSYLPLLVIWPVYFAMRYIAFGNFKGGGAADEVDFSIGTFVTFHRTFFGYMVHPSSFSAHWLPAVGWILFGLTLAALAALVVRHRKLTREDWIRLCFAGPLWYLATTILIFASYFSPRHNAPPIIGLIVFGVLVLAILTRGLDRVAELALTVAASALALVLLLPPTLAMSRAYDQASRIVDEVRQVIIEKTRDLPDGSNVWVRNIPWIGEPPWYFACGLQNSLRPPFHDVDLPARIGIYNEADEYENEWGREWPSDFDLILVLDDGGPAD